MKATNFTLLFMAFLMREAGNVGWAGVNADQSYRETGCQAWL